MNRKLSLLSFVVKKISKDNAAAYLNTVGNGEEIEFKIVLDKGMCKQFHDIFKEVYENWDTNE
mgnify:CR=1 FL=1